MKILVVGAGATGGYFGTRLAQAGRDVTFLVRPGRARQLRSRGLRIVGAERDEQIAPVLVEASGLDESYDLVLFAVKSTALEQALDDLAPAISASTVIVPFLNGLRHMDALGARFGSDRVLGGVVRIATDTSDDGDILYLGGIVPSVEIGEQDGSRSERLSSIASELTVDGFDVISSDDIMAAMWHKWVFIVALTATTTLMGGTIGDVAAVPGGPTIGTTIVEEAATVSAAAGYPMTGDAVAALGAMTTRPGSPLTTSLYRDLTAGRPTETEPMVGDFVERARALSVATPVLKLALARLRVYEYRRTRP